MALSGVITYRLLEAVDVETGHWCPRCALPSALKIVLASIIVVGNTEGPLKLSTRLRCEEGGHGWLDPVT